jgi:threonine aldolase
MPWVIKNQEDGTLPIDEMEYITNIAPNEHVVPIQAISLESSMNNCQGKVLRMDYIQKVKKLAKKKKLLMHLDGARSWNAALFLDLEMKQMVEDFDLISVCFSKGMGCPVGSALVGSQKLISQARVFRKMLGGGMR